MSQEINLTEEQQKLIIEKWNETPNNPPSLKDLTKLVFGGDFDGRSEQGKLIKQFLSTRNLRAKAASDKDNKIEKITLTDEHKLYIANNIATNTPLDIARDLFKNPSLTNLNAETRAVSEFAKTLDTKVIYGGRDAFDIPDETYKPAKTVTEALKKINEYVSFVNGAANLNAAQKKCVERLIEYLHTYSFIRLMNTFEFEADRKTCEDAFIRYTYDKPDLTQEEIDQYIELCNHKVQGFKVQKRSETLQRQLDAITESDEAEKMKISMSLVEAIGKASTEYHQCIDRQKKLLEALTQKRSARLDSQIRESATILNLVQAWKLEEQRKKFEKYAKMEQEAVAQEVERLESLSELKARFMGLPKDQALYG